MKKIFYPIPHYSVFKYLELETISTCNRKCPTCLRESYPNKEKQIHKDRFPNTSTIGQGVKMTDELFYDIIEQSLQMGFTGTINLQHYNEPLLDDRLVDFAKHIKSKKQIVGPLLLCSNFDLLTEEIAKNMDGVFDIIQVALYMTREKQRKREMWIDSLFDKTKIVYTNGIHVPFHYNNILNQFELVRKHSMNTCWSYNAHLYIAYDGTVLQCCEDYAGHFGLGNVNETPINEIWNGEKYKKLVNDLSVKGGRWKYDYCSKCPKTGQGANLTNTRMDYGFGVDEFRDVILYED